MELKLFKDISKKDIGSTFEMQGKIEVVRQTSGPTLMVLNDGTSNFTFKAFVKPGVRAFPECDIGDYVYVKATINARKDDIEGEVREMKKLSDKDQKALFKSMEDVSRERVKVTRDNFTIKSDMLESQKERFKKVAEIIKLAIIENRPIFIRHNADCDGYSSAITIERAIIAFMDEVSGGDKLLQYQNYRRSPSKAPFYEYEDAVKDVTYFLRDKVKNGMKEPLIVITDNGSTEEDILSIKQMKVYGCPIVVIDHHYPGEVSDEGKVEVDKYIDAHINPYLTGFDSNISAGMLGYELANFIYDNTKNSVFIPAMSAILDHTEGPERDQYLKAAKKEGFTEEYLSTLGEIVDMQSHYLRFMEGREFVDDLFGNNMEAQKALVEMLGPELKRLYENRWQVASHYCEKIDFGPFYLMLFDGEKGTNRGEYPAIGKSTNHIHRKFEETLDKPVVTGTFGSTFLTIRAAEEIKNFNIPLFCRDYVHPLRYTGAEGGGHEYAGSVKFVEYGRSEVIELFKKYLEKLAKEQ